MVEQSVALWIAQYGYPAIFFLLIAGIVGFPVPDQLLLLLSGYLVLTKTLAPLPTISVAILGTICGITASYALGRIAGARLMKSFFSAARQQALLKCFSRFGSWTLILGYFVPGVRNLIGFASGTMRLKIGHFVPLAYTGAIISSVTCVGLGYFFGLKTAAVLGSMQRMVLFSMAIPAFVLIRRLLRKATPSPSEATELREFRG